MQKNPYFRADFRRRNWMVVSALASALSFSAPVMAQTQVGTVTMPFNGTLSAAIYDSSGQVVRRLHEGSTQNAGSVPLNWDGKDDLGFRVPSDSYQWRAITTQATGVDDGNVGDGGNPPYGSLPGSAEHSAQVQGLAFDPSGNLYQVSRFEEAHPDLRKWNPTTNTPLWAVNYGYGYALAADGSYVYVARDIDGQNRIDRVSVTNGSGSAWSGTGYITANSTGNSGVWALAVDSTRLWVSNFAQDKVQVYNKSSGALLSQFNVTDPRGIAADSSGNAWVACDDDSVIKYSATGQQLTAITSLNYPVSVAYGGPNNRLYIAIKGTPAIPDSEVRVYDPGSLNLLNTLFSAGQPGLLSDTQFFWPWQERPCIAVAPDGTIAVTDVTNFRSMIFNANGTLRYKHLSDPTPLPFVDPASPNTLISRTFKYSVNHSGGIGHGQWELTHNWRPTDGRWGMGTQRRIANRDYLFLVINREVFVYLLSPTGHGMRLAAIVGVEGSTLYNSTDVNANGVMEATEKIPAASQTTYTPPHPPGIAVDMTGNIWIARMSTTLMTVKVPLLAIDSNGTPSYDWDNRVSVVGPDTTHWAFNPQNMYVDPFNGRLYRLGLTAYRPSTFFNGGGAAVDIRNPDGTRLNLLSLPTALGGTMADSIGALATDTDGEYFYTGHSGPAINTGHMVRMWTWDGLYVAKAHAGASTGNMAGWIDNSWAMTAFTHPGRGQKYVYAGDNLYGKHMRYRFDNVQTTTRSSGSINWTASPQVITVSATNAAENGQKKGVITLTRDSIYGALTVNFTIGGTATVVADYSVTPAFGTSVTIPANQKSVSFTITPANDTVRELPETVQLAIATNASYTIGTPGSAAITIVDNDLNVSVAATDANAAEPSNTGTFTITRDNTLGDVTVRYAVSEPVGLINSATVSSSWNTTETSAKSFDNDVSTPWTSGSNVPGSTPVDDNPHITFHLDGIYNLKEMRVLNHIEGGNSSRGAKDVEVLISTDGTSYTSLGIKRFEQAGTNPQTATFQTIDLGGVSARYVKFDIKNNYYNVVFDQGIPQTNQNISRTGVNEVKFYESGASASDYSVDPTVTATAYGARSGSLTIPDGQASGTVTIAPVDDTLSELAERVGLVILPDDTYQLGTPAKAVVTIEDNEQPPATVTISTTDANAAEANSDTGQFTVTRNGTSGNLVVGYSFATTPISISSATASTTLAGTTTGMAFDNNYVNAWISNGNADNNARDDAPFLTFNFASVQRIGRLRWWPYVSATNSNREPKDVEILASVDGTNFTSLGTKVFPAGLTSNTNLAPTDIELGGVPAQKIMLRFKSNYYGGIFTEGASYDNTHANRSLVAVNEIQFFGANGSADKADLSGTLTGEVTIPNGSASATITIAPVNDNLSEGNETVVATLVPRATYIIGTPDAATVSIADNDSNAPPSVTLTTPDHGSYFTSGSTVTLSATASDVAPGNVTKVQFYHGTQMLFEDPAPPYSYSWTNVPIGVHEVTARAYDNFGVWVNSPPRTITVTGTTAATFVTTDTSTQGSWSGVYGADGYYLSNGDRFQPLTLRNLPSYARLQFTNGGPGWNLWAGTTTDSRALSKPGGGRIAASWFRNNNYSFEVTITDGNTHEIALYCLDWDNNGRGQTIEVVDAETGAVLDSRTITAFNSGKWLVWDISGRVRFNVTKTAGNNSAISGIFFGPP